MYTNLCFMLYTILHEAKSGVTSFHPSLLSCPLHRRVCGYVHHLACYTPGFLVISGIMPATPHGFLLCSPSDPVRYTTRFLVRCIVLDTTLTVFSLDFSVHCSVSSNGSLLCLYTHCAVLYRRRFFTPGGHCS